MRNHWHPPEEESVSKSIHHKCKTHLLVRKHRLINRIVIDNRFRLISKTPPIQHQENPLGMFVELRLARRQFLEPTPGAGQLESTSPIET